MKTSLPARTPTHTHTHTHTHARARAHTHTHIPTHTHTQTHKHTHGRTHIHWLESNSMRRYCACCKCTQHHEHDPACRTSPILQALKWLFWAYSMRTPSRAPCSLQVTCLGRLQSRIPRPSAPQKRTAGHVVLTYVLRWMLCLLIVAASVEPAIAVGFSLEGIFREAAESQARFLSRNPALYTFNVLCIRKRKLVLVYLNPLLT